MIEINDMRDKNSFKSKSFSNYKVVEVKKQLISTIKSENIIDSYYWLLELFCSGHFHTIWDCILLFLGSYLPVLELRVLENQD